jgi:hypothetical protein
MLVHPSLSCAASALVQFVGRWQQEQQQGLEGRQNVVNLPGSGCCAVLQCCLVYLFVMTCMTFETQCCLFDAVLPYQLLHHWYANVIFVTFMFNTVTVRV